jgi:hypothetical protein
MRVTPPTAAATPIADALVDTYGPSLSLVTCARERAKGFQFPSSAAPGGRIRLAFPLQ